MTNMSVFAECWQNMEARRDAMRPELADEEVSWLVELNQAAFAQLEARVSQHVKLRVVPIPAFECYVEAAGGYGVDRITSVVHSYRFIIPEARGPEQVEAATQYLLSHATQPNVGTVFFYMPILPMGNELIDGKPNRQHMVVRLRAMGDTVDVP
jgi:hypothetical protein